MKSGLTFVLGIIVSASLLFFAGCGETGKEEFSELPIEMDYNESIIQVDLMTASYEKIEHGYFATGWVFLDMSDLSEDDRHWIFADEEIRVTFILHYGEADGLTRERESELITADQPFGSNPQFFSFMSSEHRYPLEDAEITLNIELQNGEDSRVYSYNYPDVLRDRTEEKLGEEAPLPQVSEDFEGRTSGSQVFSFSQIDSYLYLPQHTITQPNAIDKKSYVIRFRNISDNEYQSVRFHLTPYDKEGMRARSHGSMIWSKWLEVGGPIENHGKNTFIEIDGLWDESSVAQVFISGVEIELADSTVLFFERDIPVELDIDE